MERHLNDESGAFFRERSTAGTSVRLPAEDAWVPGMRYTLWITVLLDSGRRLVSDHQTFYLTE